MAVGRTLLRTVPVRYIWAAEERCADMFSQRAMRYHLRTSSTSSTAMAMTANVRSTASASATALVRRRGVSPNPKNRAVRKPSVTSTRTRASGVSQPRFGTVSSVTSHRFLGPRSPVGDDAAHQVPVVCYICWLRQQEGLVAGVVQGAGGTENRKQRQ